MKDQVLSWFKTYGGWVIATILAIWLLYILFRPITVPDNKVLQRKIDSLYKVNAELRANAANIVFEQQQKIDSLTEETDKLVDQKENIEDKVDALQERNSTLYNEYMYAKKHNDRDRTDSLCDIVMKKHYNDSATIALYMQTTNKLIFNCNEKLIAALEINKAQGLVIKSDSVLIANQKKLNEKQTADIKKLSRQKKAVTWVGRTFALTTLILGAILISK